MHLTMQFDTENIDWEIVAAIYEKAGFPGRTAPSLEADFKGSEAVCFAYDVSRPMGAGRVRDGRVLDLCVLPSYVGYGPALVMYEYLAKQAGLDTPPIVAGGEVEREFIKKAELTDFLA